jgi:Uma2 family endonuclease
MVFTKVRTWTVDEYHRMFAAGILSDADAVELLDGQVIEMSPQEPPHAATTRRASRYLDRLLEGRADVRSQLPITLQPMSEPEPDIAVVRLDDLDYANRHPAPADIFLIIEISDSTLRKDRQQKALIYAKAQIPEYWILAVNTRQAFIFRDTDGDRYQTEHCLSATDCCSMVALPDQNIPLSELFLPQLQ